jgi:hypothetical protein
MSRVPRFRLGLLLLIMCAAGAACQLKRPDTPAGRMIEPQLPQLIDPQASEPATQRTDNATASPVRLLDTQARAHIGRRILHQEPDGELTADAVWWWSSAPDRYLDTALRLELASSPVWRPVESASAPVLAATLLSWQLESAGGTRLLGAVEFRFTAADRGVHTVVVRQSEPVSGDLPGDLAAVAGRLLRRLAVEGLTRVARER